jgi:signal transduction histidine kinase
MLRLRLGPGGERCYQQSHCCPSNGSANAQLRIIEDLLDSARVIAGKLRIELEPVDLVSVLEAALDTAAPAAEAKGCQSSSPDFAPSPGISLGDSTRLQHGRVEPAHQRRQVHSPRGRAG